ncbi:Heterokaryon incompatibility protein 6, OR allele [Fusarium oxysporum f. sp. albedinis]|nr:Heterokaryon incompatibility protein 6, OR allele [Fusarium oxysporum f. sp. albedinis]
MAYTFQFPLSVYLSFVSPNITGHGRHCAKSKSPQEAVDRTTGAATTALLPNLASSEPASTPPCYRAWHFILLPAQSQVGSLNWPAFPPTRVYEPDHELVAPKV